MSTVLFDQNAKVDESVTYMRREKKYQVIVIAQAKVIKVPIDNLNNLLHI